MEKCNNKIKRIIKQNILIFILLIEIVCPIFICLTYRYIKYPTTFYDDKHALIYILKMNSDKRNEYINKMQSKEKMRLMNLMLAYRVQKAIKEDKFTDTNLNKKKVKE